MQPTQQPTQPAGDAFDQAASAQGLPTSGPSTSGGAPSQPQAQPAQSAPATAPAPAPSGDAFDQAAAQHDGSFQAPASGHTIMPGDIVHLNGHAGVAKGINPKTQKMIVDWGSKPRWNPFSAPDENTSEVTPSDLGDTPNAPTSFLAGTGSNLAKTVQGAAKIVHAPASMQSALEQSQQQLTDAKNANPVAGGLGSIAGDALQFLTGEGMVDAAGKAIPLADAMAQSSKIAKLVEKYPKLAKAFQAALKAGATQGTIGTVSSGGDIGEGAKQGLTAGALMGAGAVASKSIPSAYRALYPAELPDAELVENPTPVYDTLHQGLRDVLDKVAGDEGVEVKPSTSIRDVAKNTANSVRAKASGLYKQMDDVLKTMSDTGEDLPGRCQKFDEDIDKLTDKISDAIGEPEKQAQYDEALQQVKANKQIALNKIKDAGLPEDLPEQAAAIHKKARALEDLSTAVQKSTNNGLRPEFAKAGEDSSPERLDPAKLSKNLNTLYDNTRYGGRRLVQAVGDGADDLLTHADSAKNALERIGERATAKAEQVAKIAKQRALARTVAGTAAATAGLSGIVGAATHGASVLNLVKGALEQ